MVTVLHVDRLTRASTRGFTLIELMVAVTVLGVLAVISAPYLGDFVLNARLRDASQQLRAALVQARSEAITRNAEIDVVPNSPNWGAGWQIKAGALVLLSTDAFDNLAVPLPSTSTTITYRSNGRTTSGGQTIVLAINGASQIKARCVVLDASGRASVMLDSDSDASNGCA